MMRYNIERHKTQNTSEYGMCREQRERQFLMGLTDGIMMLLEGISASHDVNFSPILKAICYASPFIHRVGIPCRLFIGREWRMQGVLREN